MRMCAQAHAESCLTFCSPVDCSPSGSSVYAIFQARILDWGAISYSRGSSQPKDQTHISHISCIGRRVLDHCAAWEALLTPDFTPYGKGIAGCPHYDQAVGQADAAHGGSATLGREQV